MRGRQRWLYYVFVFLVFVYATTLLVLQGHVQSLTSMRDDLYFAVRQGYLGAYSNSQRQVNNNNEPLIITTYYNRTYTIDFAKPSSDYVMDETDLWETASDSRIPPWMKDYFRWHKEQRAILVQQTAITNSSSSPRLLVMSCFPNTRYCGGTADRLTSLPFMILHAAMFHRVLLVQWGRPAELQEFLLPPRGGVDWRVPDAHKHFIMTDETVSVTVKASFIIVAKSPWDQHITVLRTIFQSNDKGAGFYNTYRPGGDAEPDFSRVYSPIWNVFFTPSPPVRQLILNTLTRHHLVPGSYVAVHLRALYKVTTRDEKQLQLWARNGIDCASALATSSSQFYYASDSIVASEAAVEYGKQKGLMVVTGHEEKEPIHLDERRGWQDRQPSDYFGSFHDLYMMSMGHCVAHGIGSFGVFAAMISNNASCVSNYHLQRTPENCSFRQPPPSDPRKGWTLPARLFAEPMENVALSHVSHFESNLQIIGNDLYPFPLDPVREKIWERSAVLPQWAKDYFAWHAEQRRSLTEENWSSLRYIVMGCFSTDLKCGGTADRLQPLPFVLREAAASKRILFIHWDVPAPLDAFLLPPRGGVDWRLPRWMYDKVAQIPQSDAIRTVSVFMDKLANEDEVIIRIRIQSHTHGSDVYNEKAKSLGEPPRAWREHFHDLWYTFFTPAPSIAAAVEEEMERLDLLPSGYAYAHIRALYNQDEADPGKDIVQNWTKNALNCLSELRGGPYFVSSDSSFAKEVAIEYGRQRHTRVVARLDEGKDALHVDHVKDAAVDDLYSVFIDLYLMSFGECMVYNLGNFGKMASLISGRNFTCNARFWTNGVNKASAKRDGCPWIENPMSDSATGILQRPLFLPPME